MALVIVTVSAVAAGFLVSFGVGVGGRFQLGPALCNLDRIHRQFARLAVEPQPKTIGQQLLQHLLLLVQIRLARSVGRALDIKTLGARPRRGIDDLMLVDGVGERHQTDDALISDRIAVANRIETLPVRVRIVGFDGGHRKRRMCVGRHRLHRRLGRGASSAHHQHSRLPTGSAHSKPPSFGKALHENTRNPPHGSDRFPLSHPASFQPVPQRNAVGRCRFRPLLS
ncbi:MAG TPA: hypothetical protein VMD97_12635 [Candidatus Aquilonibacter sp.]|nr:hypothetical protein [Candidatus Aquilonibacter sp.]